MLHEFTSGGSELCALDGVEKSTLDVDILELCALDGGSTLNVDILDGAAAPAGAAATAGACSAPPSTPSRPIGVDLAES